MLPSAVACWSHGLCVDLSNPVTSGFVLSAGGQAAYAVRMEECDWPQRIASRQEQWSQDSDGHPPAHVRDRVAVKPEGGQDRVGVGAEGRWGGCDRSGTSVNADR